MPIMRSYLCFFLPYSEYPQLNKLHKKNNKTREKLYIDSVYLEANELNSIISKIPKQSSKIKNTKSI